MWKTRRRVAKLESLVLRPDAWNKDVGSLLMRGEKTGFGGSEVRTSVLEPKLSRPALLRAVPIRPILDRISMRTVEGGSKS
jgi:hypothetical protein